MIPYGLYGYRRVSLFILGEGLVGVGVRIED